MKLFLFLSALACNIVLYVQPFEQQSEQTQPAIETVPSKRPLIKCKPEPKGLAYSDLLKGKAAQLQHP